MFMNVLVPAVGMSDWDLTIHYHAFEVESSYLAEKKNKFWSHITFIPHLFPLTPPHRIHHMKGGKKRKKANFTAIMNDRNIKFEDHNFNSWKMVLLKTYMIGIQTSVITLIHPSLNRRLVKMLTH